MFLGDTKIALKNNHQTHSKFCNNKKITCVFAVLLLFALFSGVFCVIFNILLKIEKLENEIATLKNFVDGMKNLIDEDFYRDVQEYEENAQFLGDDDDNEIDLQKIIPIDNYEYFDDYLENDTTEDINYQKNINNKSRFKTPINQQFYDKNDTFTANNKTIDRKNDSNYLKEEIKREDEYSKHIQIDNMRKRIRRTIDYPFYRSSDNEENDGQEHTTVESDENIEYRSRRNRHRQRERVEMIDEKHIRVGRMRPQPAIQFEGDTSRYVYGQHENYNGNGHLRHPQRTFVDWKESGWVEGLGMDRHFSMENGILTIKGTGLYLVYAQIYYLDEHDVNGYRILKNEETLLQCTTMTHSEIRVVKDNTCYTAGVAYLTQEDEISVSDLGNGRYSLFEPGKSFFGVVKLGEAKLK